LEEKSHWTPPFGDCIKINTDASYVVETGQASIGLIAPNSAGQLCFCAGRNLEGLADAEEAEAYAVLDGVQLAARMIQGPVIVESDCTIDAATMTEYKQIKTPCDL
jgi:ribonuclease HI